jgi:hypothetical protein
MSTRPQNVIFMSSSPPRRFFTRDSANRSLVLVKRVISDVMALYQELIEWQDRHDACEWAGRTEMAREASHRLAEIGQQMRLCMEELQSTGAELKDWSQGIVDFPCRSCGWEVRLCWRYGEAEVAHWHEVGEGFISRRPVQTLPEAVYEPSPLEMNIQSV